MIRSLLLSIAIFSISTAHSQFNFERIDTISVINGVVQDMPWAGGIDYPQFSNIDLNWDGVDDLFAFDRTCDKVLTFIHSGTPGSKEYTYAPEYEELFPSMIDWCLLVDYNCDGKKDIFTYTIGGAKVFKNVGDSGTGHAFELAKANLKTELWGDEVFMYISSVDMPAIVDIDGDGDIDILAFGVGGQTTHYHKNMSVETHGVCDSLIYETKNQCWGRFRESSSTNAITLYDTLVNPCNGTITNEESVLPQQKSSKHAGSTVLALDMNNNGVMDLILGDISFPNMNLLMSDGTAPNMNAAMMSVDPAFPSNSVPVNIDIHPAGYHVDVNNDGERDMIVAASSKIGSENREGVWYYQNSNIDLAPTFDFVQNDFLQADMIENGSGALPVFFDHNADGLKDLLVSAHGQYDTVCNCLVSKIAYYENTGTASVPEFTFVTEDYQNISQLGLGSNLVFYPTFGDLDNDGDEDMILGEYTGYCYYMENTAGAGNPAIFNTFSILNDNTLNPIFEGTFVYPQLVDLDRDNDLDLVLGKRTGKLTYFENTGNVSVPIFTEVTMTLGGVDVSEWWNVEGHSIPQFMDINNQYHLIVGSKSGAIHYYDNIDGNLSGNFHLVDTLLQDIYIGTYSAPAIHDITADSRLEMALGNWRGGLALYKSGALDDVGLHEHVFDELNVYPNPSTGELNIDLGPLTHAELNNTIVRIIDLQGREIARFAVNSNLLKLQLAQDIKGMYLLEVSNGSATTTRKVLFQ